MNKIDYEYTNNIICPFCGHEDKDSWEVELDNEETLLFECGDCEKEFYATKSVTIDYSTEKARYGICKKCNTKNVVIENYTSSDGSYEDFCITCGDRAKYDFRVGYFEKLEDGNG